MLVGLGSESCLMNVLFNVKRTPAGMTAKALDVRIILSQWQLHKINSEGAGWHNTPSQQQSMSVP